MKRGEKSGSAREMLENTVLKWSLDDIMNGDRFRNKVKKIPQRFMSVEEYFGSFIWPLIEEMRAELQQSLESVSQATHSTVIFQKKIESSKGVVKTYEMLIDRENDIQNGRGKKGQENLKLKPMDILILSTRIPENLKDFHDHYLLALVCSTQSNDSSMDVLKVKVYVQDAHPFTLRNHNMQNKYFAIYLNSMISSLRIWMSLHRHLEGKETNLVLLSKAISSYKEDNNESSPEEKEDGLEKLRNRHFMSHILNASQASAVIQAVNAVQNNSNSDIKLIQGPPGTGKTSMLISLLSILVHKGSKVLVCAPTNAAILEVAIRFLKLIKSPSECCPYTDDCPCIMNLSDLILVGNEERFDHEGPFGDIFLTYRVDRLVKCFLPMTGWRHSVTSLLDFLESAISRYEVFQETPQETGLIDFAQYIRERLKILVPTFCEVARTLLNDLPGPLSEKHELECLIDSVESLVNLIEKNEVNERVLRECFSSNSEDLREPGMCTYMFNENMLTNKKHVIEYLCLKRSECMQFLRRHLCSVTGIACIAPKYISRAEIEKLCLSRAKLVFSTVSSSGKRCMNMATSFDCLIIDEAAQLTEAESTIALQIRGLRHAFLIGDPNQLPATVISQISEEAGFGRSLFERLKSLGHPVHLLNTQYRMHPLISQFPNMEFYENHIVDGRNVKMETYGNAYLEYEMYGTYAFINVRDGREEGDDFGRSKSNAVEAAVVLHILCKLHKVCSRKEGLRVSVGVISPYSAQVLYLENKVVKKDEWSNTLDVEVKSVDGFQGGEKDIIIISTVRTNNIGFLSDCRRANVALTRARYCLWIVGNGSVLLKSNSVWEKITRDAIVRKCFIDPNVDNGMVKVIRKAKADSDQLQDLLNKNSVLFNNTNWKVIFSIEFKDTFTKIKSLHVRQQILNTVLKLANGWRQLRKQVAATDECLINEYKTSGLYLVWTIDVEQRDEVIQVLKIWNVLNLVEVSGLRKRLENIFATCTPEYIRRCNAKAFNKDAKTVLPRRWKADPGFVWYMQLQQSKIIETLHCETFEKETITLEHARVQESLLLMKFYSLSAGIASQLLTAKDGSEIDLQFEVNEEESCIIRFPRSSFILGRSGTGKTTVLTTKLLQKEHQLNLATHGISWETKSEFLEEEKTTERRGLKEELKNGSSLRQMFVTVSAKLCSAIRKQISGIDRSLQGKGDTPCMEMHDSNDGLLEFQNIPDSFIDIPDKHFPMVITFHKFLMMLDGSVQYHFFNKISTQGRESYQLRNKDVYANDVTGEVLVHSPKSVDDSNGFEGGDGDSEILDDETSFMGTPGSTNGRSVAFMEIRRRTEVNYERFDSVYWPHFSAELIKGLESSMVFTEIISHIKGSIKSTNSPDLKMSREDYVAMAESRASILCVKQREAIYDLFLQYEKQKQRKGNFDIADLVNHLHHQLKSHGYFGQKMDFIYVDEVQDLPMAQIALLKYVCSNVGEGFVFAGDTAQTIARGVHFRFEDIRSLFYKEFLEADGIDKSKEKIIPDLFHLSRNFRTHTGITKLAQSVVELLYYFFPFSVDRLGQETSLIYGEAPIFLDIREDESLITTLFGHGGNSGSERYEFGAEQAILVRDDDQKAHVLGQVGKQCLVLTILECKGLEFQDVLLYNFFSSSPLGRKWRVIYNFMNHKVFNNSEHKSYPNFDNSKHNILCSEVKQLYVAITRAKQRLWIYDENLEYPKPMLDYWKELGIIDFRRLDRSLVQSMYVASTCEDWKQRGIQMFNEKNYDMAIFCFERAKDINMARQAKAAKIRQAGQQLLEHDADAAKRSLIEAAEIFLSVGKADLAARCFIIMGDYRKAGMIFEERCSESQLQDAGDCFAEAKCWSDAVSAYARANCVSKCLKACLKGKLFETGLEFIKVWKNGNCNSDCGRCHRCEVVKVETEYLKKCAAHYHQKNDTVSMMKFVNAFPTVDLIRSFLSRKDYFDELLGVEKEAGNFMKAAEVAEMKGDLLLEAHMLEKAGQYDSAVKSMLLHVQLNSLWGLGNEGWPLQTFPGKDQLLKKVKCIAEHKLNYLCENINCETSVLLDQPLSLPELTEQMIIARKIKNVKLEVLSLRKVLNVHINIDVEEYQHDHRSLSRKEDNSKMLLENRISCTTLVGLWDTWKEKISRAVEALSRLEKRREREQDVLYIEFAVDYFGTRIDRNQRFCTVFDNKACWVKGGKVEFPQTQGNTMQITIQKFSMLAKEFLTRDMLSVGLKVIGKLEKLHLYGSNQHPILNVEGTLILKIYQVSKDLKAIGKLARVEQVTNLHGVENLEERFFELFFPLMRQYENVREFISLREEPTSKMILEDIAVNIINEVHNGITLGQNGRLQVLLPFLPKHLVTEHGKKIIQCFRGRHYWNNELLWTHMDTFMGISLEHKRLHLIKSLKTALTCTFSNWRSQPDYISPQAFLTLLEKLFFLSSSCECPLEGLFFPRSFFIEFMTGEQGNSSFAWMLQSLCLQRCEGILEKFYSLLLHIVSQLLMTNRYETFKWIKASKIDTRTYFPGLALRLIIMLCLICINSTGLYQNTTGILRNIFRDKDIIYNLPCKFKELLLQILQKSSPHNKTFFIHFSQAMRGIDDPLVMIDLGKCPGLFKSYEDVIVLRQDSMESKEILLQTVFQEIGDLFLFNEREIDMKGTCGENMPPNSNSFMNDKNHNFESFKAEELQNYDSDNTKCIADQPGKVGDYLIPRMDSSGIDQEIKADSIGFEAISQDETILFTFAEEIEPSHKLKVHDQYVAWFILWRMKRWLSCARRRLEEQLSMKEKYIQEARKIFQGKNSSYAETFILKACPLKAEVDEFLDLVKDTIPKVKQGKTYLDEESDILEEMHDIKGELLELTELLHPRHKKHEECDCEWLEKHVIAYTSIKLQESRDRLKPVFENGIDVAIQDSEEGQSKSKQKKQNKPKKKGHKKGGKRRK